MLTLAMNTSASRLFCRLLLSLSVLLPMLLALCAFPALATPLDDYVAKPDPAYRYELVNQSEKADCTTYAYHLVSQTWLDPAKVDRPLWEHTVLVTVPKERTYTRAMIFIGGGGNKNEEKPAADNPIMEKIAVLTKSIVSEIKQIPNQPLFFAGDTDQQYKESGRSEDELITFGWDKYLTGGDPLWLARLPMTKAVVRAMDMVQKEYPTVDGFFVAGGSKRGWTTWTVAAVDKRVFGIAPAVIDVLNFADSLENHHKSYGLWAPSLKNYVETDIMPRLRTPQMAELLKVVDPYSYRDRLTMPKYILNAGGDQYFPCDSWRFYFDGLKEEKYLCYFPNVDHGLNEDAYYRIATFYQALLAETPRPKFSWAKAADGALTVQCATKPSKVTLWKAHNPESRDFRLETLGKKYEGAELPLTESGVYTAEVKPEETGWTAFFIELEFPNPSFSLPFVFTTGVSIVPDTYPAK